MKSKHVARVITVILMCMMLVTGCAGSKFNMSDPGISGLATNDKDTQQPGAVGLNDVSAPDATANEGSVVSDANTGESGNTTGTAVGTDKQASQGQAAAAAKEPVKVKALYLTG